MRFEPIGTSGARLIRLAPVGDQRGSFARVWCENAFREAGVAFTPVQANVSVTRGRGTIRGMHFQRMPKPDAKIVRCTRGRIHDVMVDLRGLVPNRSDVVEIELGEDEPTMLYVPAGFAHGFQSLTDVATVEYLMGEVYEPSLYSGFRYDDPAFKISWPLPATCISDRDLAWPLLSRQGPLLDIP